MLLTESLLHVYCSGSLLCLAHVLECFQIQIPSLLSDSRLPEVFPCPQVQIMALNISHSSVSLVHSVFLLLMLLTSQFYARVFSRVFPVNLHASITANILQCGKSFTFMQICGDVFAHNFTRLTCLQVLCVQDFFLAFCLCLCVIQLSDLELQCPFTVQLVCLTSNDGSDSSHFTCVTLLSPFVLLS